MLQIGTNLKTCLLGYFLISTVNRLALMWRPMTKPRAEKVFCFYTQIPIPHTSSKAKSLCGNVFDKWDEVRGLMSSSFERKVTTLVSGFTLLPIAVLNTKECNKCDAAHSEGLGNWAEP